MTAEVMLYPLILVLLLVPIITFAAAIIGLVRLLWYYITGPHG